MVCGPVINVSSGGSLIVSSTTRPTGTDRYTGVRIFEADTGRELMYDGTNWVIMSEPVQSYAPTLVNITLGNGTNSLSYARSNGFLDFTWLFQFGSSSAMGTSPSFSIPVAMNALFLEGQLMNVFVYDNSATSRFFGHTGVSTTSVLLPFVDSTAGAVSTATVITATVPMTWATSDQLVVVGRYPMVTRYS